MGCSDPDAIRLFAHGKDFSTALDQKSLEELRVESGQTFLVNRRQLYSNTSRDVVAMVWQAVIFWTSSATLIKWTDANALVCAVDIAETTSDGSAP